MHHALSVRGIRFVQLRFILKDVFEGSECTLKRREILFSIICISTPACWAFHRELFSTKWHPIFVLIQWLLNQLEQDLTFYIHRLCHPVHDSQHTILRRSPSLVRCPVFQIGVLLPLFHGS